MITQPQIPYGTERLLNAELDDGETLLWSGQPRPSRFQDQSLVLVLFGLPMTAFSVFMVVMANGMTDGPPPLAVLPFVGIGLCMLSSPYWLRRKALKTAYALTERRVLILEPDWRGAVTVRSIPPAHLTHRTRIQNRDGSGDLLFTRLTTVRSSGVGGTTTETIGFQGISDVRGVDDLIRRTFA